MVCSRKSEQFFFVELQINVIPHISFEIERENSSSGKQIILICDMD